MTQNLNAPLAHAQHSLHRAGDAVAWGEAARLGDASQGEGDLRNGDVTLRGVRERPC
jgi:hypothetical protein